MGALKGFEVFGLQYGKDMGVVLTSLGVFRKGLGVKLGLAVFFVSADCETYRKT